MHNHPTAQKLYPDRQNLVSKQELCQLAIASPASRRADFCNGDATLPGFLISTQLEITNVYNRATG